jgi:hypothetical protein
MCKHHHDSSLHVDYQIYFSQPFPIYIFSYYFTKSKYVHHNSLLNISCVKMGVQTFIFLTIVF